MQPTNKDSAKLVQLMKLLHPHITSFSDKILEEGKHKDPVTCGGVVKGILDMSNFSYTDDFKVVHTTDTVYVTINDAFGELLLIVPGPTWRNANATFENVIVAEGILYSMDKEGTFINKAEQEGFFKRENDPLRVLVATIAKLKESI